MTRSGETVIGVDMAVRTAHHARIADQTRVLLHPGYRFRPDPDLLERSWSLPPAETAEVTMVMEPTRRARVPVASRRGSGGETPPS